MKPAFLVLLVALALDLSRLLRNRALQALVAIAWIPVLLVTSLATLLSGWIILDASRPAWPSTLLRDPSALQELTALANEMVQRQRITWVGNGWYRFMFVIRSGNTDYQFATTHIPRNHHFRTPVEAEDISKVPNFDSPFLSQALRPTDKVLLDPNDYAFCRRASRVLRRIGLDDVQSYPEHNVVQFQICEFIGWDNGWRYVYYFCPAGTLPERFKYQQQLNANWYFARKPRFSD